MAAIYTLAPLHHSPPNSASETEYTEYDLTQVAALTLNEWGFALRINQEPAGLSTDSWRSHHAAAAYMLYHDAIKAGLEGRMEVRGLFSVHKPPSPNRCPTLPRRTRQPRPRRAATTPDRERRRIHGSPP